MAADDLPVSLHRNKFSHKPLAIRVANTPGIGGRVSEFNSISRLPLDAAREMIISRNASNLAVLMVAY